MRPDVAALPVGCDLRQLGIDPAELTAAMRIRQSEERALYRLACGPRSFVLKWFAAPHQAVEVRAYALLAEWGVPTLPVHGRTANALLLEDLAASGVWRLATEDDLLRSDVGSALAEWYRVLHAAGRALFAGPQPVPGFLRREVDALDAEVVLHVGERLGLGTHPVWRLAAAHVEALKSAIRALPTTLTYNDFHWTNLALTREATQTPRAVVFDYHLLGIGPAYGDWRNVTLGLGGAARQAFQSAYGAVDEREAVLDAPVSVLHALQVAEQRPRLPRWALPLVREATDGTLEAELRQAISIL